MDMHATTMEELRKRNMETKESEDAWRRESFVLVGRAERASQEARNLKRRVDELLVVSDEAKELKSSKHTVELEKVREEAARVALQSRVHSLVEENERLRTAASDADVRAAVMEATSKVDAYRKLL